MLIDQRPYRAIWLHQPDCVQIIDQRSLPHELIIENLTRLDEFARAIRDMHVRGAPLIGATAAYGMYIAALHSDAVHTDEELQQAKRMLDATRPTAVNLMHATLRVYAATTT
ncbi:MAG: S-methyl-5-thioribose-1-phosphate isomerase, partial [Bacteroidota bacterium]